jgi:hypothetical protein
MRDINPNLAFSVSFLTSLKRLSLAKMLAGANAFEMSDIERMNTRAH